MSRVRRSQVWHPPDTPSKMATVIVRRGPFCKRVMAGEEGYTEALERLLSRWKDGDEGAAEELMAHSQHRLRKLAQKLLSGKPHVRRWQQTDDVLQNALVRLHRSLKNVKPDSKRAFTALAAKQIRRELCDMARSLYGAEGLGRHHKSQPLRGGETSYSPVAYDRADSRTGVEGQIEMAELHLAVGKLSAEEREVFDLVFYQGMKQAEVAELLNVSEKTVKRRWRDARLSLNRLVGGES